MLLPGPLSSGAARDRAYWDHAAEKLEAQGDVAPVGWIAGLQTAGLPAELPLA